MHALRSPLRGALVAALCITLCARAQEPELPSRSLKAELLAEVLRVPLQPISPAEAGEVGAGFAAAEAGYKVRFVDGFELFPALGTTRASSAPLRWRTRSIAIGEHELARDAAAAPRRLDDRTVVFEHELWTERYEIRPEGVEQLFLLAERPDAHGDLVIRGAIETPLQAAARARQHAEIVFRDEAGAALVSYGAALAYDAGGRTIAMPSSFQEGEIALHLDGAWLAQASFPVTIDPLASPVFLSGSAPNGGALSSLEIEAASGVGTRNVLVAFTRAISLSDHDVYAVLCDESFASPLLVYSNLDATYSDTDAQVAFVNRHDRWMLCSERRRVTPNGEYARLRIYAFLATHLQVNAGTELLSMTPANADHSRADLGGSVAGDFGDTALLCYQVDAGAAGTLSDHSEIYVAPFDAGTLVLGAAELLSATPVGTRYDREDPALNARRWGYADGWVVGWRELDRQSASDDWDLRGVRTDSLGARLQEAELYDAGGSRDVRSFQIAGINHIYLLAASLSTTLGSSNVTGLVSRRFDWAAAATQPTVHATRALLEDPWFLASLQVSSLSMATATQSHWVIAVQQRVPASGFGTRTVAKLLRVGGTGAELERETLFDIAGTSTAPPGICCAWQTTSFLTACGATSAAALVRGTRLLPPSEALSGIYGQGCGFASISCSPPYAGHQSFRILLSGGQSGQPAALLVSLGTANVSLPVFGSPSCALLVDLGAPYLATFPAAISSGFAEVVLPLPDAPVFRGDFEAQWVHVRTIGSPTGILATQRIHVQVR
ncbi:MAG: hypothetical protein IPN34_13320 [Planctomycetes bacterium]|nr:hypothetical protein [Planctomycetota bacterium]